MNTPIHVIPVLTASLSRFTVKLNLEKTNRNLKNWTHN